MNSTNFIDDRQQNPWNCFGEGQKVWTENLPIMSNCGNRFSSIMLSRRRIRTVAITVVGVWVSLGVWACAAPEQTASSNAVPAAIVSSPARICLAGTFNDWNAADPVYQMTYVSNRVYRIKRFFKRDRYKFKFTVDGVWDKHYGDGPGGVLTQPGADITLDVRRHGAYVIELDLNTRRWTLQQKALDAPQAVLIARNAPDVNLPIILDGSESPGRTGLGILEYEFGQDTNDSIKATLKHKSPQSPDAVARLPEGGTYRFWLRVNDGMPSGRDVVTLKAQSSYQVVGDWTAIDPKDPASFLESKAPDVFEKTLKSTEPGERQLVLIKDHDPGSIVGNLTVSVTQTNKQFWRVRYDEKSKQFSCEPDNIVEFAYRPDDDLILKDRVQVSTVNLAGSFNGWNPQATPMTDQGDGTYVAHMKLDEGLYQYKLVVNGDVWLPDPNADPDLRKEDGHGGMNSGIYIGQRGKDFGPPPPDDINLAAVKHRTDQAQYLNVVSSDLVEVKLRTLRGDASNVVMRVVGDKPRDIPLRQTETAFGFDFWSTTTYDENPGKPVSYYFTLTDGGTTRNFGVGEDKDAKPGVKPFTAELKALFPTPDWAKHVVWYQIFPERLRNGTTENDLPRTLPWRWDWYRLADWEQPADNKQFSNDWYSRRFGGDFQGAIAKLPYFRELGVTALYFCPVFEANAYHGYDTTDYRHISQYFGFKGDNAKVIPQETLDPATWQWTPSDKLFLDFVQKAHEQGLKVIVDGVFNHMGKTSFALQDVLTNGINSAYADWFDVEDWGPPVKYKSWDGGGWMPNFRKDDEHGIASDSARQYLFNVTKRWMDPNGDGDPSDGIDGWRLDVAPDVPSAFWIEWRKLVKSINPRAYIDGEHWGEAQKWLQGDQWDAVMNYQFAQRAIHFFIDKQRKISASEFDRQLKELLALYPMQVNFVMQNLYDSHDTDRLVNMIINPDRDYDGCNRPQDGCPYDGKKPDADAYRVMKLMAAFQMTFLGAPMIWYGDEVGMFGADDPTDRKPMLWKDLEPYENSQDFVMPDVFDHYRRLIAIRNSYPVLRTGLFRSFLIDDANDLYGFTRTRGDEVVAVIINNSDKDQIVELAVPFPDNSRVIDLMTVATVEFYNAPPASLGFPDFEKTATVRAMRIGPSAAPVYSVRNGKLRLNLPKKSAAILVKQ